jgi:hypothetical protein
MKTGLRTVWGLVAAVGMGFGVSYAMEVQREGIKASIANTNSEGQCV